MTTKICVKCKEEKPVTEFGKNSRQKDGLNYYCKACNNNRVQSYRTGVVPPVGASQFAVNKALTEIINCVTVINRQTAIMQEQLNKLAETLNIVSKQAYDSPVETVKPKLNPMVQQMLGKLPASKPQHTIPMDQYDAQIDEDYELLYGVPKDD